MRRKAFDPFYSLIFNFFWLIIWVMLIYIIVLTESDLLKLVATVGLGMWVFYGVASYCLELDKRDKEQK